MSVAIRAITRLQDADDVNVTVGAGIDEYALCWDNDTAKFVARAVAGVYLLATGATTGATSQAQAFTNGVVTGAIKPSADSTTALQLQNAAAAAVLNVDTTNARVGIGTAAPTDIFDVGGVVSIDQYGLKLASSADVTIPSTYSFIKNYSSGNLVIGCAGSKAIYFNIGTPTVFTLSDGANTAMIGNQSATTNNVRDALVMRAVVTGAGVGAAGLGLGISLQLESSTTAAQSAARIQALWYEATHATRKADLVLTAHDTAEREGLRIRGAGSAPAIGFLGAAPVARQAHVADPAGGGTVDAEARSAINSILATLENFGLHATS